MSEPRRFISGEAGRTACVEAGRGAPVVLVHGVGLNADVWAPQFAALSADHRVIAYDTLGHGGSDLPPEGAALDVYVRQLLDVMDALGIRRAALVGHSMGAMIATAAALAEPSRIERLAALNAVYERDPESRAGALERAALLERDGPAATLDGALSRWFGPSLDGEAVRRREQVRGWLQHADRTGYARAYRVFATSDAAYAGRLAGLACPALFVTGELDPHSTPAMTRRMAAEAPMGRAVVLPGARHMAALVTPEAVNPLLAEFFGAASAEVGLRASA